MMIEELRSLKGMVIKTLAQNKKFEILDVDEKSIEIEISNGNIRKIWKKEIEEPWKLLKHQGRLTQTEIFKLGTVNSAYIAALLSKLPEVDYRLNPETTLFLKA